MQHTGLSARFLHVFRSGDNAVICAESNDIIPTAHFSIEMLKQLIQILVEPDQDVLYFPAARAKRVALVVDRRIADAQNVSPAAFPKAQLIDGILGHSGKVGIGVRTGSPLEIERGVGPAAVWFSAQRMRKRQLP